ncbi:MAG: hypothetical protein AAFN81_33825 [Bacteroidota bacterium]
MSDLQKLPAYTIQGAARFYCYTNNRWVTDSDDNYGTNYHQANENGGTGATPIVEWEHLGNLISQGRTINRLKIVGHSNNLQITDMEIYIVAKFPDTDARWETGIDNDAEDVTDVLFQGNFKTPTMTGNMNDLMKRDIQINYTFPRDGFLSLYVRPVGTLTATRYWRATWVWEIND